MNDLIVVMPIYNEAANIHLVIEEWLPQLEAATSSCLLMAINDGSKDETAAMLAELARKHPGHLEVIDKTNSGHGKTCRMGYNRALKKNPKWVLQIDSDGQCDPLFFSEFWKTREDFDCLFGCRITRDDGLGRRIISAACRMLLWLFTGTWVEDPNVPYRLIRTSALRAALGRIPPDFELQNIALSFALKKDLALRWNYIPIHFRARQGGENSINFKKIAQLGLTMLMDLKRIRVS